jgi:hypothetical protein
MGVGQLENEPGLANARLADEGGQLAASVSGLLQRAVELLALDVATDEAREAARRGGLEP